MAEVRRFLGLEELLRPQAAIATMCDAATAKLRDALQGGADDGVVDLSGWHATSVPRSGRGSGGGKSGDIYYHSPCGQRFRSVAEVRRFLDGSVLLRPKRRRDNTAPDQEMSSRHLGPSPVPDGHMIGQRVSLLWASPPQWFDGTIRDIGIDTHLVVYDDADAKWHDLRAELEAGQLRWLGASHQASEPGNAVTSVVVASADGGMAALMAEDAVDALEVDAVSDSDGEDAQDAILTVVALPTQARSLAGSTTGSQGTCTDGASARDAIARGLSEDQAERAATEADVDVSNLSRRGPWVAQHLGTFLSTPEAALAYARYRTPPKGDATEIARQQAQPVPPLPQMGEEETCRIAITEGLTLVPSGTTMTGFKCVYYSRITNGSQRGAKPYFSNTYKDGRAVSLGAFRSAPEAALAYARFLGPSRSRYEAAAAAQAGEVGLSLAGLSSSSSGVTAVECLVVDAEAVDDEPVSECVCEVLEAVVVDDEVSVERSRDGG